jgi:hypothetical protein
MFRHIITLLLFCCLTCCLITKAAADEVQLQANHPERYVVVKGDTLWDISAKFLKDPWQWPKVWKMNKAEIKNPNLIYPGDVVVLDMSSGNPQLSVLRETVTLNPGVVEEPLEKEAIKTIAPNVIAPFLTQPLMIDQGDFQNNPRIIAGPENRVVYANGSKVYTTEIKSEDGLFWHVYRPGKILVDPITSETLGIEAIYLGDARVTKFGEPTSVEIVRTKEEMHKDDKLIKVDDKLLDRFVPRAPDTDIQGVVMNIYGGFGEAGLNRVISINKGTKDGLEVGHVLAINRAGKYVSKDPNKKTTNEKFNMPALKPADTENKTKTATLNSDEKEKANPDLVRLPDERIGLLMIFRTFERVSYGLIMQASQPVNVLDVVKTP